MDGYDKGSVDLSQVGLNALEAAKRAGVAVCYLEPAYGNNIIREYPDGRREMIDRTNGGTIVAIPARRSFREHGNVQEKGSTI